MQLTADFTIKLSYEKVFAYEHNVDSLMTDKSGSQYWSLGSFHNDQLSQHLSLRSSCC